MRKDLIEWLNRQVKDAGSIRALARRSEVSHTTIADVLSSARPPTFEFCHEMARVTKVDPVWLFRLAGLLPQVTKEMSADEEELIHLTRHLAKHDRRNLIIYARALVEADEQERRKQVVALGDLASGDNFGDVNKFDEFGPGAGQPGDRGESETCERCGTVLGPG